MNSLQLNYFLAGVPRFSPVEEHPTLFDHSSTILLIPDNHHWVTVIREGERKLVFDSRPFQSTESCGLFCCAVVLAYAFGGLRAVYHLWGQFQEETGRENEDLVIDFLEEWRGGG